jgi:plastocyanin
MKRSTLTIFLSIVLLGSFVGTSAAKTVTVNMVNFSFVPQTANIDVGDTVTWVNTTAMLHNSVSGQNCTPDGLWSGALLGQGQSFSETFNNPGTFNYYCAPHCGLGMTGIVVVSQPADLWQNATDLGNGWKWLSWFGYFNTNSPPWIFHQEHGWLYPFGTTTENITFWDPLLNAFWWSSQTQYPYLYRFSDGVWLYYQVGSSNPRWFYNLSTGIWESH